MPATLTTLNSVLKEFYGLGWVNELNNELHALNLFEKMKVKWAGRLCHVPVKLARNTGVAFNSAGTLPASGQQGWGNFTVNAEKLYGRGSIDGDALEALEGGDAATFVTFMESEVEGLKEDMRDRANQVCISGGTVIGFMFDQNRVSVGADDWGFDGDFAKIQTLASVAAPLEFVLVRMSDKHTHPNPIAAGGGITAGNATVGTVTLSAILDTTNGAGGWNTALIAGDVYAVVITGPAAALTSTALGSVAVNNEPNGIYTNLGAVSPFERPSWLHAEPWITAFSVGALRFGTSRPVRRTWLPANAEVEKRAARRMRVESRFMVLYY